MDNVFFRKMTRGVPRHKQDAMRGKIMSAYQKIMSNPRSQEYKELAQLTEDYNAADKAGEPRRRRAIAAAAIAAAERRAVARRAAPPARGRRAGGAARARGRWPR